VNEWLSAISPQFKTPWVATALIGLIGAILTATSSVAALVTFTGVMLAAEYAMIAFAAIYSRIFQKDVARPYKMPLWPLPPLVALVGTIWTLALQSRQDLLITAGILIAALAYYYVYLLPRGDTHWQMLGAVHDPEEGSELAKNIT
jgi:amino acid transporter